MRQALTYVFLLALVGCQERTNAALSDREPEIVLSDKGKEPRNPLRYSLALPATQTVALSLSLEAKTVADNDVSPPRKSPTLRVRAEVSLHAGVEDGQILGTYRLTSVDISDVEEADPSLTQALSRDLNALMGAHGTFESKSNGQTISATMPQVSYTGFEAREMLVAAATSIVRASLPLPNESIGVGAKWELTEKLDVGGVRANQTSTYELLEFKNERGRVRGQIVQYAPRQKVTLQMEPSPQTMEILSLDGAGNLELEFRPGLFLPRLSADIKSGVTFKAVPSLGKKPTTVVTDSHIELDWL